MSSPAVAAPELLIKFRWLRWVLRGVIDAKVTMQLADKVVFVVRWQKTSREMVTQSIDGLGADRRFAGIVLGMVDEAKVPRYGPYSYYSSYHYKNYYQN